MIKDINGTVLTPGNMGKECIGNGTVEEVECCCEECDYMICCFGGNESICTGCEDTECPRFDPKI